MGLGFRARLRVGGRALLCALLAGPGLGRLLRGLLLGHAHLVRVRVGVRVRARVRVRVRVS